ncbi:MAG: RDD family protein [Candidatus Thiothrix singaporensis]|uniref:RDD family protein n=1 Tax=Candidatus Thiothrix singaporensis TaxID=2799669 RepID=A0A7L6APG7_9GAMM|nr:MAG: RDD family protein [Candidatus Thiothrix singaporensis]
MSIETASLLRRLGAMIYDTVLAGFSIVIVAGVIAVLFSKITGVKLPDLLMVLLYLALAYGFFTWFWTHGGQTLGMRAWKIQVVGADNQPISQQQASLRFLWSAVCWLSLGIGFLVSLTDRDKLAGTTAIPAPG